MAASAAAARMIMPAKRGGLFQYPRLAKVRFGRSNDYGDTISFTGTLPA